MRCTAVFALFLLFFALPARASQTSDFQQQVSLYTSGSITPQEFFHICTTLLKDAPLADKNLERQIRLYRGAVNIQLNNLHDAHRDALFLLEHEETKLTGARILAAVYAKRYNYPGAIAVLEGLLRAMDEGQSEAGLNRTNLQEEKAQLERDIKNVVQVPASGLAGEIAASPAAAVQKYSGKILMVAGVLETAPVIDKNSRLMLTLRAAPPLTCFLDMGEAPYLKSLEKGDTITVLGPLKPLNASAVISSGRYLEDEDNDDDSPAAP